MSERKPPTETALDVFVYAPLGFVLEARQLLPTFVERGRNQVAMARMVGQFAVQQGQVEANRRLGPVRDQVKDQVDAVLGDLGLVDRAATQPPPTEAPLRPRVVPGAETHPAPAPPPAPPPADLAIPDYESLAASQVVPRLRALSASELEAVRAYEAAGRGRKTILNRIAQIQGV